MSYGAHNLSAAAFGTCEEGCSMGILSVHSMWLLPTFLLLVTELLHFISLEMTEEFASSDANKQGFLVIVSFITSLSNFYALYVTIFVRPGWRSLQCDYCRALLG